MGTVRSEQLFLFVGNHLCFDVHAKVVDADQGKVAIMRSSAAEQKRVFDAAIALRKALGNMAEDIAAHKAIPNSTLTAINQVLSQCPGYPQLACVNRRVESRFHSDAGESSRLLTPLTEAASDLLCYGNRQPISCEKMPEQRMHSLFLRHHVESRQKLLQHAIVRQSHESRSPLSEETKEREKAAALTCFSHSNCTGPQCRPA